MDEVGVEQKDIQPRLEGVQFIEVTVADGIWSPNKLRLLGKLNPLQKTWVEGTYQTTKRTSDPNGSKFITDNYQLLSNGSVFHGRDISLGDILGHNKRLNEKGELHFVGLEGTVLNVKKTDGNTTQVFRYQGLSSPGVPPPGST
ncbi:hypothetical protein HY357_03595 [Candidatus Roizmanbacteria bacterium]|nr:hypothetical protein [Candidatus Roizmanbacteria bacterium]